ncbi:MAG: hypothetical protein ACRDC5_05950 [Vibrio sp.]
MIDRLNLAAIDPQVVAIKMGR